MKYIVFFISAFLLSTMSFAKGHGGGGGHGGGHSGGGHGHAGGAHTGGGHASFGGVGRSGTGSGRRTAARTVTPTLNKSSITAYKSYPVIRNGAGEPLRGGHPAYSGAYYGEYVPYNYYRGYNPYYYNPFFFSPYFSIFSFGADLVYTPHYNYNNPDNEEVPTGMRKLNGYAVYANDTIGGLVTITPGAVFVENIDSGKHYDYKFRLKQQELAFVNVYNTDSTQMCMTRLKEDPKKLYRIVHEGILNVYDRRYGFIYRPEDIGVTSVMVVYNGEAISIGSFSAEKTKLRLLEYMNKAYGLDLNPNKFSWRELLIYLDKLN